MYQENIVLLDFYNIQQDFILDVLENYPRMRDISSTSSPIFPHIILAALLAELVNKTIFSKATFDSKFRNHSAGYPVVHPFIQLFDPKPGKSLYQLYNYFHNREREQRDVEPLKFVHFRTLGYNFGYCDVQKVSSYGDFSILLIFKTADFTVWIYLLLSIALISVVISIKPEAYLTSYPELIATLSVLLSAGFSGVLNVKRSPLFVLWMYMCVVMVTYYSSSMTSVLIRPPADDKMTRLSDLQIKNYSLVFDRNRFELNSLKGRITRILNHMQVFETNSKSKFLETFHILNELLNRTVFVKTYGGIPVLASSTSLPSGLRHAVIASWAQVMYFITRAQAVASEQDVKDGKRRICRVGEKLFLQTKYFYGFAPPGSAAIQEKFNLLMAQGVVQRWMSESVAITSAPRVQKRIQVKSPTQLAEQLPPPKPLEIEGKIKNVFVLWAMCLGNCAVAFLLEMVVRKFKMGCLNFNRICRKS